MPRLLFAERPGDVRCLCHVFSNISLVTVVKTSVLLDFKVADKNEKGRESKAQELKDRELEGRELKDR